MLEKRRKLMPALIFRDETNKIDVLIFENQTVACRKIHSAKKAVDHLFEDVQSSRERVNQSFITTAYFCPKQVAVNFTEAIACSCWSTKKTYTSSVQLRRKYVTRAIIAADPIADEDVGETEITWETKKTLYRPQQTALANPSICVSEEV